MKNELIEKVIPAIESILRKTDKSKSLYSDEIIKMINTKVELEKPLTQIQFRQCINYMRRNKVLPIMAGSNGYYITDDIEQMAAQVESFNSRIKALEQARDGIIEIIKDYETEKYLKRQGLI